MNEVLAEKREHIYELDRLNEFAKNFNRKFEQKIDDAQHKIEVTKLQQEKIKK